MSAADGERIAPVTYLFGAKPSTETEEHAAIPSPSAALSAQAPTPESGPRFVDLGGSSGDLVESRPPHTGSSDAGPSLSAGSSISDEKPVHRSASRSASAEPAPRTASGRDKSKGSFDRISNVSMYALARRGMSSREMRDYLLGREFESSEVDIEIERLEKVALLDDHALAETLIRTLQSRKGLGRSALTAELRRRNVDSLAVESALAVLDDDDELERAVVIAMKRAGQLRSLDATTAKRRLGDFLMRRGYSGSVVSKAVQAALAPTGPTFR